MANLVTYAKTAWQDLKTAITAARLNNMEQGISDCATQINKLGDSVSRSSKAPIQETDKSVRYVKVGAVVEVGVYIQVESSEWKEIVSGLPSPVFESYFHATANDSVDKQVKLKISPDGTLSCRYMGNASGTSAIDCMFTYLATA